MTSNSPADYQALAGAESPKVGESVSFDVYVHLPNSKKFIRYVCVGDLWDARKASIIAKHTDPTLYKSLHDALVDAVIDPESLGTQRPAIPPAAPAEIQVFNDNVDRELKNIFKFVSSPEEGEVATTIKAMEDLSKKIIEVVAPDVENLRENILQQSKYLMVMTDAAAITSISVMVAMAHGFDSRKIFRDMSLAVLLMDAPFADLGEDTVVQYYKDRNQLTKEQWEAIRRHPARAHEVVSTRLKSIPDSVLQLILNHHELYNGKGYPRQIRNESLPATIRSLSLSVDVFEIMKREHYAGNEIDILTALDELQEKDIDPHLRRHNQKLVQSAISYVRNQSATPA